MQDRHPAMEVFAVAAQGHAPFIAEPDTIGQDRIMRRSLRSAECRSMIPKKCP